MVGSYKAIAACSITTWSIPSGTGVRLAARKPERPVALVTRSKPLGTGLMRLAARKQ